MHKALYREYRPMVFEDVIGQDHIIKTLINQINTNNLSHTKVITYRCFLPNLTRFMSFHCLGPIYQHYLTRSALQIDCLGMEFNPAKADCGYRAPLTPHLVQKKYT